MKVRAFVSEVDTYAGKWQRMPWPSCRVRVVWDEENLHQLESTKSPKQKITEPKTPYYALDDGIDFTSPYLYLCFQLFDAWEEITFCKEVVTREEDSLWLGIVFYVFFSSWKL